MHHQPWLPFILFTTSYVSSIITHMYQLCTNVVLALMETVKDHAEILDPDTFQGLKVYTDTDLNRDLISRRFLSSVIIKTNITAAA